jgi:circadian clock protein KaiC
MAPGVAVSLPRMPSGIFGLDHVTGGGLPAGEVTLVAGATGTGTTVISGQFLAAGITEHGEPAVFVSLAEVPGKVRRLMATLGWDIDAWEAAGTWAFVDGSPSGQDEIVVGDNLDFTPLVARTAAAVHQVGAKRVVVDSLSHLLFRLGDAARIRSQVHQLIGSFDELGVTAMITVERDVDDGSFGVAEFVADNIVILRNVLVEERRRRTVEVLKLRGAPHRTGEFPFVILPDLGAEVIALSQLELTHPSTEARVSFGIPELDVMCGGGPYRDSVILVAGATGTGKTLVGLAFLDTSGDGERSLLVALEESEAQLTRNARGWGHDLDAMVAAGRLRLHCTYPETAPLPAHLIRIQQLVEEFAPTRVVIDSLSALERGASERDFHEFLLGLTSFLKARGVTALYTTTPESLLGGSSATGLGASTTLDMIVLLRYVEVYGELHRGIILLKMRGSDHEKGIREFVIGPDGVTIGAAFRTTTGILAGDTLQLLGEERGRVAAQFEDPPE